MIKLENDYFIDTDDLQYILYQWQRDENGEIKIRTDSKSGKESESKKVCGYYTRLEHALEGYAKRRVRESVSRNDTGLLEETLKDIRELKESLSNALYGAQTNE